MADPLYADKTLTGFDDHGHTLIQLVDEQGQTFAVAIFDHAEALKVADQICRSVSDARGRLNKSGKAGRG